MLCFINHLTCLFPEALYRHIRNYVSDAVSVILNLIAVPLVKVLSPKEKVATGKKITRRSGSSTIFLHEPLHTHLRPERWMGGKRLTMLHASFFW